MGEECRCLVEIYLTNKKQRGRLWEVLVKEENIDFKVVQGEYQYQELEQQLSQLQQEKEELIKWLEDESHPATITDTTNWRDLNVHKGAMLLILNKLKDRDK